MLHLCCRLKRRLTEIQTTNVDMASEVAASSGRESHHLHCIQSLSSQTAKLQAENTELTGKVSSIYQLKLYGFIPTSVFSGLLLCFASF